MRDAPRVARQVWLSRFVVFYGLWWVVAGWTPWNAVVGIPAAAVATRVCAVLLPGASGRLAILPAVRFAVRFLWQSVVGGVDVAWRVFHPSLPLRPGVVRVRSLLPAGPARLLFRGVASLQPGSLACGEDGEGRLLFHCLDTHGDVEGALLRAQAEVLELWVEAAR